MSFDEVELTITADRLQDITKNWEKAPPIHMMIAAYIGITPPEKGDLGDLLGAFAESKP